MAPDVPGEQRDEMVRLGGANYTSGRGNQRPNGTTSPHPLCSASLPPRSPHPWKSVYVNIRVTYLHACVQLLEPRFVVFILWHSFLVFGYSCFEIFVIKLDL